MQTFTYTVLNGCLPCCKSCGITTPLATGDEVNLYLDQDLIPFFPVKIEATVFSVTIVGTKTEYVFLYNEADIAASGVTNLVQCMIEGYPTCRTLVDDLEDRIVILENDPDDVVDPLLTARVVLLEDQVFPAQTTRVCGLTEFLSALALPGEVTIELTCDITFLTGVYNIPYNKFIVFGKFKFIQGGDARINYYGGLPAIRQHFFSGFRAGQIRGPFHMSSVYPEWWGIQERLGPDPTNPTNRTSIRDDIALQCAFDSAQISSNGSVLLSTKVEPAIGHYFVARPLWATPSIELTGAGPGRTKISATENWLPLMQEFDANWVRVAAETTAVVDCAYWPEQFGLGNHCAMLFIGGDTTTGLQNTFRSTIRNVWLNATLASQYHWNIHISCITALNSIEENTLIENIMMEYPSGFGFGIEVHRRNITVPRATSGFPTVGIINGLTLNNFEVTGPCKVDQVPIYIPVYTYSCRISKGTINMSLAKSLSTGASATSWSPLAKPGFYFGSPGDVLPAIDDRPLVMQTAGNYHTYPDFGIVVRGVATISNMHFEGMVNAIFVEQAHIIPNSVTIENYNTIWMMDRARGAVWSIDGLSGMDLSTTPYNPLGATPSNIIPTGPDDWKGFSCGVLIDQNQATPNLIDSVVVKNMHNTSGCLFMFRDRAYGWNHRTWNRDLGGLGVGWAQTVTSYERGSTYVSSRDNTTGTPYASVGQYTLGPQPANSDFTPPTGAAVNTAKTFFRFLQ